jgi:hypothetical protein
MKTRWYSKAAAAALTVVMAAATAAAGDEAVDLAVRGQALLASQDEDWSSAHGFSVQFRFAGEGRPVIALVAGVQDWDAVSEYGESDDGVTAVATSISGAATVVPVGVSLLHREPLGPRASLLLEAGLRYAFVESDITVEAAYADDLDSGYVYDKIDIDDTLLAVAGVDIAVDLTETVAFELGLGYQFDLLDPEEQFLGESLGETSFDAGTVRFGVRMRF